MKPNPNPMEFTPTPSQTIGPFFHLNLTRPEYSTGRVAGPEAKGEHIRLCCRVFDGKGVPVDDAMIELWQADAEGRFNSARGRQGNTDAGFQGFGRLATGADGGCEFETIKPGRVAGPADRLQAPHILVAIFARGMLKQLYTRVYFAGDPANGEDAVLALVPEERRKTLMAQADDGRPEVWRFEINLQGERETVFFDL